MVRSGPHHDISWNLASVFWPSINMSICKDMASMPLLSSKSFLSFLAIFYFPFYFPSSEGSENYPNTTHLFERFSVVYLAPSNDQVLLDFPQSLPVQTRNAPWVNIAWPVCIAFKDSNVWSPTAWTNGVAIAMWPRNFFMPPCRKHHNKQNWGRKRDLAKVATRGCQHVKSKFCIVTYNDTKLIARTNIYNTYQGD